MATDSTNGGYDFRFSPTLDGAPETYYTMWTITEEGLRYPERVHEVLMNASQKLSDIGGRCRLYVAMGGPADLIGVAKAKNPDVPLSEQKIMALQRAVQASGVLTAVFFKAREFTAQGHDQYTQDINALRQA